MNSQSLIRLVVKLQNAEQNAEKSIPDVLAELAADVAVEPLDINAAAQNPSFSKDARQFVGI